MLTETQQGSFIVSGDDPLSDAHAAVAAWIKECGGGALRENLNLKMLPSGQRLLKAKPPEQRRYVLAALVQAGYWECLAKERKAKCAGATSDDDPRVRLYARTDAYRNNANSVIESLIRRDLPLESADLAAVIDWCVSDIYEHSDAVVYLVRAIERFASRTSPGEPLLAAMRRLAAAIRSGWRESAAKIDAIRAAATKEDTAAPAAYSPTTPSPAGTPGVLVGLKRFFGMPVDGATVDATVIGPDNFPMPANSPLQKEHELLNGLLMDFAQCKGPLLSLSPDKRGRCLLAAADRHGCTLLTKIAWRNRSLKTYEITEILFGSDWQLPRDGLFDVLLYMAVRPRYRLGERNDIDDIMALIARAETEAAVSPLTEGERFVLSLVRSSLIAYPPLNALPEDAARLSRLISDGACLCLVPGEVWGDAVNDALSRARDEDRQAWLALFRHMLTATASKPTSEWMLTANRLVEALGAEKVAHAVARWFALVEKPPHFPRISLSNVETRDLQSARAMMNEANIVCLKGLLWLGPTLPCREELLRPIGSIALSAYKKLPGIGARAIKIGNAAIYALSQMASTDAVGQLAMLKTRVKFGTAQREIEKAFNAAAGALNLPRDEIEELGVPSYGVEEVGRLEEVFGEYKAELVVNGSDTALRWFDSHGNALKSAPAKVKREHKEELKDLQQSLKDIQAMLPAQRDRIDSMFLTEKSWPFAVWRERYLDHPLVGTIARRLIWCVDGTPAVFIDGKAADVRGELVEHGETAEIALWHPVGRDVGEVVAWRGRLAQLGITQPFKQAHREVYLLTDAERTTNTYSNRFAAHILRQHQFNALCAARGWKNKLRLLVEEANPPAVKELPRWGLRAEFWIEGIGGDFGRDTNETGVFLRLSTDQVRFYCIGAAPTFADAVGGGYQTHAAGPGADSINDPLALERIPPLAFSEIMRDVDLFVGVSSVGNDPTWQDGGPEGRYLTYWQDYAFGELSGSAATRKEVLQRLVPRLKIADRCSFSDRSLVVRGKKRTYKIHLGSGNILMGPNDQYLCIVPDARAKASQGDLFLPFEGDNMLSIILSKALLLADDDKIKDPTITRQINGP